MQDYGVSLCSFSGWMHICIVQSSSYRATFPQTRANRQNRCTRHVASKLYWIPFQFFDVSVTKQSLPEDMRTQMKQKKYLAEKYEAEQVGPVLSLSLPTREQYETSRQARLKSENRKEN